MRYAESIRYGGQLIEAQDCDHDSYKMLGLLCPECKSPVFLRTKHERLIKGKYHPVEPTFSHFKAVDASQIARCVEKVVLSTYVEGTCLYGKEMEKASSIEAVYISIIHNIIVIPWFEKFAELEKR